MYEYRWECKTYTAGAAAVLIRELEALPDMDPEPRPEKTIQQILAEDEAELNEAFKMWED